MKSLREAGGAVPRLFSAHSLRVLRRLFPLAGLVAIGAGLALSPASALQLACRVGFQLPGNPPLATDPKGGNSSLIGLLRAKSNAPLTVAISGPETGDAQLVATVSIGAQTTTCTRAVRLAGAPQTIRMTLTKAPDSRIDALTLKLMQNGRSLAQQETRLITSVGQSTRCVLDLTENAPRVSRSLRACALTLAQRSNAALTDIHASRDVPRHLTATPESLPDSAQAYGAIDAVVLDYAYPLESASAEQQEALQEYVRQGGRLILVGASRVGQISTLRNHLAALQSKPVAAAPTENYGLRAAVDGAGVVFSASDSALSEVSVTREYQNYRNQAYNRSIGELWQCLLGLNETPRFAPKQALTAATQYPYNNEMTDALAGRQAAQTVPFPLVAAFLLAYIVLVIPVNYLVLKKLDRRELAWVTAPVLVFLFSGASYAVASAIKGGKLTVNRAVIYEAFANTDTATGYGQFTLYSPRRAAYDLSIGDPNDAANPYRNTMPTEAAQGGRLVPADLTIARAASVTLQNVAVPIYDTRSFTLPVAGLPGGGLEARMTLTGSVLRYTLTNHTPYDLHHCYVAVGDQSVPLSDLKAGETAQATVAWNGSASSNGGFRNMEYNFQQSNGRFGLNPPKESAQDTRDCLRDALRIGLQANTSYANGYDPSGGYTNSTRLVCGFIGWFDAKTLDVRVDGKPAAGEQENMLYVHLPLPQTANNLNAINSPLQWIPDAASNNAVKKNSATQEKTNAQ